MLRSDQHVETVTPVPSDELGRATRDDVAELGSGTPSPRWYHGNPTSLQWHSPELGIVWRAHFPITPDIVGKICLVALEMANSEDLTTGIHPFTFAYLDSSEIAEAYAIAEQYKMLHDDRSMLTLQDAIVLSTPGWVKLPRSLMGPTHSLTFAQQAMENAVLEAPNFVDLLNQIQLYMPWEPTLPSHFYDNRTSHCKRPPPELPASRRSWPQLQH
jgi:hypothetical protein